MSRNELIGLILGIIGAVLGIPAFVLLIVKGPGEAAAVISLAAGLVFIAVAVVIHRTDRLPPFTALVVEKTLSIGDKAGEKATVEDVRSIKANHKAQAEYWFTGISADGDVGLIKVDGTPASPESVVIESKQYRVRKHFYPPLDRGSRQHVELSYELINSFKADKEYFQHEIAHTTKRLRMTVHLPPGRPCREARAMLQYGGTFYNFLPTPVRSQDGLKIEFEYTPKDIGAQFVVNWDW